MSKRLPQACLCFLLLASLAAQETSPSAQPSITAESLLNWNTRLIQSVISLDAQKRSIQLPTGRNAALQMIEMETPSLLKDTFFSIIVNSSQKLGNSVENNQISLADLNRIIDQGKKTPPYFSQNLQQLSMSHTVSLAQIGTLFIHHKTAFQAKAPLSTVPSRPYTGIIIDARGMLDVQGEYVSAPLVPCLFPRIWSSDMDLLYEKNMVMPAIASQNGIVFYFSTNDETGYRERIGTDPLRITARKIFGENRTDPVISNEDYLKIMSVPKNRQLLNEGKVVILCDEDALSPRKLGPLKDENYYFTARDITDMLAKKPASRIDFTSSWEGLKLTIYDIRFVADTSEILPEERNRLDVIADALKLAGQNARFVIEGHTASIGKPTGELTLSVQRAQKIAGELANRGIEKTKIEFFGYGGTRPLGANDTDEGRAKNRRVEITISLD